MAEVKFSVKVSYDEGRFVASVEGQEVHTWATSVDALIDNVVEALRLHLDDDDSTLDLVFHFEGFEFPYRSVKAA